MSVAQSFSLTTEQEIIACSPVDFPQVVFAPPGTGKTHTVIARIQYLLTKVGLSPEELLVLCFTRSAVAEIMNRLKNLIKDHQVHDDLRFVSIKTFDSFATHLLMATNPERSLSNAGFNARIQIAVAALADPESEESIIVSEYQHVIVDEIQDLVGSRAQLVQILLQRISGGFTLLGDPAQSIYDFSKDSNNRIGSKELLEWVTQHNWPGKVIHNELRENFRSTGHVADIANRARKIVLDQNTTGEKAETRIKNLLSSLPEVKLSNAGKTIASDNSQNSVCILCRTHGELLQIAGILAAQNIEFYIRPRSDETALPPWIARILSEYTESKISRAEFENRWNRLVGSDIEPGFEQALNWLKHTEGQSQFDLDIQVLRAKLSKGARLPDEADGFLNQLGKKISLSTIHASKGREFNHVVILQPRDRLAISDIEQREEARVLYVAATRAKDELSNLARDGLHTELQNVKTQGGRSRWLTTSPDGNKHFMEVGLLGDMNAISFVNKKIFSTTADVKAAQESIWQSISPGKPLDIRLVRDPFRAYLLFHSDTPEGQLIKLGQLSGRFWNDLLYILRMLHKGQRFKYPVRWTTVKAIAVTTEVFPSYPESVYEPYASSGFCLGIRIKGLVEISVE